MKKEILKGVKLGVVTGLIVTTTLPTTSFNVETVSAEENKNVNYLLVQYLSSELTTMHESAEKTNVVLFEEMKEFVDENTDTIIDREALYKSIDKYRKNYILEKLYSLYEEESGEPFLNSESEVEIEGLISTFIMDAEYKGEVAAEFTKFKNIIKLKETINYLKSNENLRLEIEQDEIEAIKKEVNDLEGNQFKVTLIEKVNEIQNKYLESVVGFYFVEQIDDITFGNLDEVEKIVINSLIDETEKNAYFDKVNQYRESLLRKELEYYDGTNDDLIFVKDDIQKNKDNLTKLNNEVDKLKVEEVRNEFKKQIRSIEEEILIFEKIELLFDDNGDVISDGLSQAKLNDLKEETESLNNLKLKEYLSEKIEQIEEVEGALEISEEVTFKINDLKKRQLYEKNGVVILEFPEGDVEFKINDMLAFIGEDEFITIKLEGGNNQYNFTASSENEEIELQGFFTIKINEIPTNYQIASSKSDYVLQHNKNGETIIKTRGSSIFSISKIKETALEDLKKANSNISVKRLVESGVLVGVSQKKFGLNKGFTRAEAATIMNRISGVSVQEESSKFKDVKKGAWYYNSVNTAVKHGYMVGIRNIEFAPNQAVTKEELAVLMVRILEYNGVKVEKSSDTEIADLSKASSFSKESINALVDLGLITLDDGNFEPKKKLTREEVAEILYEVLIYGEMI